MRRRDHARAPPSTMRWSPVLRAENRGDQFQCFPERYFRSLSLITTCPGKLCKRAGRITCFAQRVFTHVRPESDEMKMAQRFIADCYGTASGSKRDKDSSSKRIVFK